MSNRFFITLLVIIAVIVGGVAYTKQSKGTNDVAVAVAPTNQVKGSDKTGVVLTEYGDFQCPACGQYYPLVKQLFAKYQDRIIFQFRNFPLTQIHQNAFVAHRAGEAADKQGKFWEMHDLLYENQKTWQDSNNASAYFVTYAKQLGLDIAKFQQDMASQETNNKINADIKEGQALKATSTPTFVIDGKKLETNPRSLDEFYKLIDEAIAKKTTS